MAKSSKNVVEEWARNIKKNADIAYQTMSSSIKQEYIQKVIGNCETILATLECCEDEA